MPCCEVHLMSTLNCILLMYTGILNRYVNQMAASASTSFSHFLIQLESTN